MTDTPTPAVSGRRRWWSLLTAVVLVAGLVGGAVWDRERAETARLGTAPTDSGSGTTDVRPADVDDVARSEAIDEFLAKRSAAIMAVDEQMFLEDIDATATQLVAAQRTVFANLVDIGLAELRYEQRQAHFDQALVNRYGPTAYSIRIAMSYRIKGVDPETVKTELGYTFAERNGNWLLVDDDDLDAGLTPGAHREPWDLGRLEVHRSPRLMVLVDKGRTALARTVMGEAQEALATLDKYWPRTWRGSVLISATDAERVRDADFAGEDTESSASATGTYRSLPGEETGEGVFAGAYVVINPAEHKNVDEILLSHEFTHVATIGFGGYEPLWLAEGAAEYVSWKGVEEISGRADVTAWETDVQRNALPRMTALPADKDFYNSPEDVYGVSWLAVGYLVRRLGIGKVADLYEDIAKVGWSAAARDQAMRSHTGMTEAQLFAALKTYEPSR